MDVTLVALLPASPAWALLLVGVLLVLAARAPVSNEIVERCHDLSRPSARAAGKADARRSMRWVLIHMIEETARHAGHADILRAQADGSVGR
ncbi:DUF664 domain-containing protein [Streptomyces sp. NPDC059008]|uniref:mycothiol transferase n=1 Tax=Streptomyces sp. NPDC059008 TaxID=3346693 RepID=UPI0036C30121